MHIAERAPTTQFLDEPVIREELSKMDTETTAAVEREADTASRVTQLRRLIREFEALRFAHEKLVESVTEFGKCLQRLEDADPDAP